MATGAKRRRVAGKRSVLVVDDDEDVRELLKDFFELDGFLVTTLADPSFAISWIREQVFDLIVVDVVMPKITGLDLLAQIRAIDADIAVLITTSCPSLESAEASIEYGATGYVWLPFAISELREEIARIMMRKRAVWHRGSDGHTTIGRQIYALRKARGLTLTQLAQRTKLSIGLVSQIERAESSASASNLSKLAMALDVQVTDLVVGY